MFRRALVVLILFASAIGIGVYGAKLVMQEKPKPAATETETYDVISNSTRGGFINSDETWEGTIFVTENIVVDEGITLTIRPNTTVKFKNNRNYKKPEKLTLEVRGTLKAVGTKDELVTFTSDAPRPRNGDWGAIHLIGQTASEIRYAIVEHGMDGIVLEQSDATVSHSIIRWMNHDGITADRSTPVIEHTRVYENGENGITVLQSNGGILRSNLIEKNGEAGIHLNTSQWSVENSVIKDNQVAGMWMENGSALTAMHNSISQNGQAEVLCGRGMNTIDANENAIVPKTKEVDCPESSVLRMVRGGGVQQNKFEVLDTRKYYLLYTPGDVVRDRYPYAYPEKDDTRTVTKKLGRNVGPVLGVAVGGQDVWALNTKGVLYTLNAMTGETVRQWTLTSRHPTAIAFDGTRLWVTDFDERRTYALDPQSGVELASFQNPDSEHGATGLASDGRMLYIKEGHSNKVHEVEDSGLLSKTITLSEETSGGIAFDGTYLWAPCSGAICRFGIDGTLLGKIYAVSEGAEDMEWEPGPTRYGGYLWIAGKTNDHWTDDKLFKVEITSDSLVRRPSL